MSRAAGGGALRKRRKDDPKINERRQRIKTGLKSFGMNLATGLSGAAMNAGMNQLGGKGKFGKLLDDVTATADKARSTTEKTDKISKILMIVLPIAAVIGISGIIWKVISNKKK